MGASSRGQRRVAQLVAKTTRRHRRAERQGRHNAALERVVTVRVEVPDGHMPDSYLDIEMPEGDVHAVLVNQTAVENGFFDMSYRPVASTLWRNPFERDFKLCRSIFIFFVRPLRRRSWCFRSFCQQDVA